MESNKDTLQSKFSIEDTMEMGVGDQQLLHDLVAPETSPDEIEEIVKEVEEEKPTPPTNPKIKEVVDEGEEIPPAKAIQDFLSGGEEEEENEEEVVEEKKEVSKKKEVAGEVTEEEDVVEEEGKSPQFSALANDLFNLGVFTKEEGEEDVVINTPEEFLERFQNEKKRGAIEVVNNFIGQFGEDYQQAFDAIYVKGVNPKDYFEKFNKITDFKELDISGEENKANQIKVIRQALADQGFESEDIETEIERLENYGDLETVAAKHHKVLVKKEAATLKQLEEEAQYKLQQKAAIKNQYITNVQQVLNDRLKAKEFDGIPLNPKLASELHDFLLVDKWKTPSGENLTDFDKAILDLKRPENHEMKVKLGLILKILEKDPTLSTIQKTGVTKRSNQLFGDLAKQVVTDKTSITKKKVKPTSWFQ